MFHTASQNTTPDFAQHIKKRLVGVDKTYFIKEILEEHPEFITVLLYPPSGKSYNLSMLRYFLDKNNQGPKNLFKGMYISKHHKIIAEHQNRYTVVYLDFSHLQAKNEDEVEPILFERMCKLCQEHKELIHASPESRDKKILESLVHNKKISTMHLSASLRILLACIQEQNAKEAPKYHEKPFLIIDCFDSLIAYDPPSPPDRGVILLQSFFQRALEDNPILQRAVIADVSKKHWLLPGNCCYFTPEDPTLNQAFGFTLKEVEALFDFFQIHRSWIKLTPDFYRIKSGKAKDLTKDLTLEGKGFRRFSRIPSYSGKKLLYREVAVFHPQQVFELVSKHLPEQARIPKESWRPTCHHLFYQPRALIVENPGEQRYMEYKFKFKV